MELQPISREELHEAYQKGEPAISLAVCFSLKFHPAKLTYPLINPFFLGRTHHVTITDTTIT